MLVRMLLAPSWEDVEPLDSVGFGFAKINEIKWVAPGTGWWSFKFSHLQDGGWLTVLFSITAGYWIDTGVWVSSHRLTQVVTQAGGRLAQVCPGLKQCPQRPIACPSPADLRSHPGLCLALTPAEAGSLEDGERAYVSWCQFTIVFATQLCLTLCDPMEEPAMLLWPWDSPGKNTGKGCHSLLQGIFLTQGLNPGLWHCRQILYQLSHQGSQNLTPPSLGGLESPTFWLTAECADRLLPSCHPDACVHVCGGVCVCRGWVLSSKPSLLLPRLADRWGLWPSGQPLCTWPAHSCSQLDIRAPGLLSALSPEVSLT